jgi:hypothetical protein
MLMSSLDMQNFKTQYLSQFLSGFHHIGIRMVNSEDRFFDLFSNQNQMQSKG